MRALWARIQGFRPAPWVIPAVGVALVALLVWFAGPLIALAGHAPLRPWWARLLLIALIAGGVAAVHFSKRSRAKRRNAEMVTALAAEPAPDLGETEAAELSARDLQDMRERADKALALMRTARVGEGKDFVYDLPWYVIIGPPGAGKSTAIHNCGLKFPVAQELGAAPVRGVGGTRTTEWWFTDQAVLIDTAGRYTTQDSHAAADAKSWRGLLDLLKKHRPRQPLTGVLVAVSVPELIGRDEQAAAEHGRAVRQRINELTTAFGVRLPVYVLLTKIDLLAGFTEFFDTADAKDREQVWGHTFAYAADAPASTLGASAQDDFNAAFDALLARLNDRLLSRVQEETDIQRRGVVFGFPPAGGLAARPADATAGADRAGDAVRGHALAARLLLHQRRAERAADRPAAGRDRRQLPARDPFAWA